VTKMVRNVFALQQNLTNIITFNQEPFDRVRRYYELLNLSVDVRFGSFPSVYIGLTVFIGVQEVFQRISEHIADPVKLFTMHEYRIILELLSPTKKLTDKMDSDLRDKFSRIRAGTAAAAAIQQQQHQQQQHQQQQQQQRQQQQQGN